MSLVSQAAELKQQGALEAARNPNSSVTAADAEQIVLNETKKAGGMAIAFDPNATPAEKAAQARSHIPAGFHHERKPKAAALASDADSSSAPKYDLPPPTKAGAIAPPTPTTDKANGVPKDEEERWARVGWEPRFGMPGSGEEDEGTLLDHETFLEGKLDDKFFGDWYHNTGVIIFACLSSWLVAVLGGGLGWIFIIMTFCGTYYRTSIRRVRRNYRDDISRELAKNRLETDNESLEWINSFLVKFWPIYAPVLCETIVNSVDQVLSTSTPAFLDSLRMKLFTLGTKPPRLEHVKTYPKAQDDIVLMDWKFSFAPNDTSDLTSKQIKNKQNPKIVLEVRVGKGMISKGLDVIVEDMAFSGLMRVKVKLQIPFPHIEKVEICFLGRPTIDYSCKPLGGDNFGFDINFIPGLESFIMEQVHANLGPMMYEPNVFPIEIAKMLAGNPIDQAIGVIQVTFHGAQGLKNPDKFSGTPDPYAVVTINGRQELGRTKTVHENANPRWNETINIIVSSLKDSLDIQVFDYNEIRKDKELGVAHFALEQLETDQEHENAQLEVIANGRPRGIVQADIRFFPVLEGSKLEDGTVEPPPESLSGIAKFTVESAKELDSSKSMIGQLNPYAVLLLNGKEVHISKKLKRTNNPIFPDATKELLITERKKAKLGLVIKDDRDLAQDPILGTYQIKLDDMLEMMAKGQEWYQLAQTKSGRAKMTVQWKPVALKGSLGGSGGYVTPIGVIRIHFQSARELRNLETVGKSDPYGRVLLSGIEKGRTVTFKNNLNPDWDEVIYVPIHSTREKLTLEVMDSENLGKDRSLGHIELPVADLVKQGANGEYLVNEQKTTRSEGLRLNTRSSAKGTLNYTCSFYPTLNVVDPEEEKEEESDIRTGLDGAADGSRRSVESNRRSLDNETLRRSGTISSLRTTGTSSSSDLAKQLTVGEKDQEEVPAVKEVPKIKLSVDDLAEYESGLIIFKLIDGELSKTNCHLEVVMDDMAFASYTSAKIKKKTCAFNETGDAMVRELDFSKITLRLVEEIDDKGDGEQDHVIAKVTGQTLDTLRLALYKPTQLVLRDNEGRESKVTVSLKYLPVKMRLDPSESFNNSGTLRVEILDAADLPAADRNGYSDPYCKFILNGKEVHKTATQKKTLHPAWNEFFEVQVRSRTAAQFEVKVYDWDFGDKADFLGRAAINLDILEPFQQQEVTLGLDGKSGTIRLKMLFKPDYVTRVRQGSSTFHGTFATPGKVIGAPVKGVGKGAVFVGGNVVKGASFLGRGFKRSNKSKGNPEDFEDEKSTNGNLTPPRSSAGDGAPVSTPSPHIRHRSFGQQSIVSQPGGAPGAETGTASFTVISASDFPADTNLRIHIRKADGKEILKSKATKATEGSAIFSADSSDNTTRIHCSADAQFKIIVKDHATFGSDEELGEAIFFIGDQGSAQGADKTVIVGPGKVVLRTGWVSDERGSVSPVSTKGLRRGVFGAKRESRVDRERSATPGA
ncbi:tricalbin [Patellaria atrata CBS 101060]|uniref:Tricalbin n=1 Tax=Patellaria atrata CBS 101060 TaxID=1346257 RepID=A0A9P4SE37_9PEZI|nr:tricalbin [Patellaria atrata CBS 101060]